MSCLALKLTKIPYVYEFHQVMSLVVMVVAVMVCVAAVIVERHEFVFTARRVARGGAWVNVPPSWIKRIFLPLNSRHDCPSTGVTCQTLQLKNYKGAKMCNFNVDFSKIFQTPILGRGYGARGVATGGYRDISPKSAQVNFLWGKNDIRTAIQQFYTPKKLYPQKKNLSTLIESGKPLGNHVMDLYTRKDSLVDSSIVDA